ncbi:MAG: hypothetical protein HY238_28510 [Acidobacteria bacterium]|nr:hypothetical protein [Acidobacteriota bacterium]
MAGCSKKESSKVVEGETVSKNPLGLARQLAKAGQDFEKMQKDLENMKPVEPVHFSELIRFLPDAPSGWESEAPKGSSNTMGEWSFTEVSRHYTQGEKRIEIQILDWAYHKELYASFFVTAAFSTEDTEGYNKGIKIGDDPGREEYKTTSKHGVLSLLVGKRFFVTITGENIEAAELRQWWDRVNSAGLRAKAG